MFPCENVVLKIYSIFQINLLQLASFLLYLSDVEEGGETMFPFEVDLQIWRLIIWPPYSINHSFYCLALTLLLWFVEWLISRFRLWLQKMRWPESEAAERGWTAILFIVSKWHNWSGNLLLVFKIHIQMFLIDYIVAVITIPNMFSFARIIDVSIDLFDVGLELL